MTFDLVSALLILLLIVREVFHSVEVNRLETRREMEMQREREFCEKAIDTLNAEHSAACDRLMARDLTEHKSWTQPAPEPKPAEEVDADWMRPNFAMPADMIETNP